MVRATLVKGNFQLAGMLGTNWADGEEERQGEISDHIAKTKGDISEEDRECEMSERRKRR
jgi:hypothetical protein